MYVCMYVLHDAQGSSRVATSQASYTGTGGVLSLGFTLTVYRDSFATIAVLR